MGTESLSFYHPNLLCCLDQMVAAIELSQHLVLSSKTVRPIIPRGARCIGHVKMMWSAVCSQAPHSHFAEEAPTHLCIDEPKRPTPVRRQLSWTGQQMLSRSPVREYVCPPNLYDRPKPNLLKRLGIYCYGCSGKALKVANALLRAGEQQNASSTSSKPCHSSAKHRRSHCKQDERSLPSCCTA